MIVRGPDAVPLHVREGPLDHVGVELVFVHDGGGYRSERVPGKLVLAISKPPGRGKQQA